MTSPRTEYVSRLSCDLDTGISLVNEEVPVGVFTKPLRVLGTTMEEISRELRSQCRAGGHRVVYVDTAYAIDGSPQIRRARAAMEWETE